MKIRGRWRLALAVAVALSACGTSNATLPPKDFSLQGLKIPVSQITSALTQLCGIVTQAKTDPSGSITAFYAGPHLAMHQLAAILDGPHHVASQNLLSSMLKYEGDQQTPPPASTASDATALLQVATTGVGLYKVTVPPCSP